MRYYDNYHQFSFFSGSVLALLFLLSLGDFDLGDFGVGDFDLGDFGIGDFGLGDFDLGDFDLPPPNMVSNSHVVFHFKVFAID